MSSVRNVGYKNIAHHMAQKRENIPFRRKFNGKYYYTSGTVHGRRSIALWLGVKERNEGNSYRIVRVTGGYVLYVNEGRKKKK